jgi:hypothetical protein
LSCEHESFRTRRNIAQPFVVLGTLEELLATMAAVAQTTGVDVPAEELRRRNVASQANAAPTVVVTPETEKSKEKV